MQPVRRDDPTLPPPWQCLFEPTQNATYYWNPTTNVTQYERPAGGPPAAAAPPVPSRDAYASQVRVVHHWDSFICCSSPATLCTNSPEFAEHGDPESQLALVCRATQMAMVVVRPMATGPLMAMAEAPQMDMVAGLQTAMPAATLHPPAATTALASA
jgi:WW domain